MNRRITADPRSRQAPTATKSAAAGSAERFQQAKFGFKRWKKHHLDAAREAWQRLFSRKFSSAMLMLLMGLALALPLLLVTLISNLTGLDKGLRASGEIAVFLRHDIAQSEIDKLAKNYAENPGIASVTIRSPTQGIEELSALPGFDQILTGLTENPLPYVLLIRPDPELDAAKLVTKIKADIWVEQVQYDAEWHERLGHGLALLQRITLVTMLLLGAGVLLLIAHNVRMEVRSRANEISIIKLLGASDGFVCRPFLWSGFWMGLVSALLAILITIVVISVLQRPVRALAESYGSGFSLQVPGWPLCLTVLAVGVLLGSTGAVLASTLQLILDRAKH